MKRIKFYRIVALWFSIRAMFEVNLGDYVKYNGNKHVVHNGVRANSWRLGNLDNGDDGWVLRSECKKIMTPSNMIHSFKFKWNFYKTSWFSIWKHYGGIGDLAKSCNIWGNFRFKR